MENNLGLVISHVICFFRFGAWYKNGYARDQAGILNFVANKLTGGSADPEVFLKSSGAKLGESTHGTELMFQSCISVRV